MADAHHTRDDPQNATQHDGEQPDEDDGYLGDRDDPLRQPEDDEDEEEEEQEDDDDDDERHGLGTAGQPRSGGMERPAAHPTPQHDLLGNNDAGLIDDLYSTSEDEEDADITAVKPALRKIIDGLDKVIEANKQTGNIGDIIGEVGPLVFDEEHLETVLATVQDHQQRVRGVQKQRKKDRASSRATRTQPQGSSAHRPAEARHVTENALQQQIATNERDKSSSLSPALSLASEKPSTTNAAAASAATVAPVKPSKKGTKRPHAQVEADQSQDVPAASTRSKKQIISHSKKATICKRGWKKGPGKSKWIMEVADKNTERNIGIDTV